MSETLYICPCCQTAGFTAAGLHRHNCRAKPGRAKLTLVEIAAAVKLAPNAPHAVMTKEQGGLA